MNCNRGYDWCSGFEVVHSDGDKHCCAFHAPKNRKPNDFIELVKKRLKDSLTRKKVCDFSGIIFPDYFSFFDLTDDDIFPAVNFSRAIFGNETMFTYAIFGDKTKFTFAKFGNKTKFDNTSFGKNTDFSCAEFGNETDFSNAIFCD